MKPVVARFVITLVIFVGCMVYQGYLAMTVSDPIIVSQPQVIVADFTISAELKNEPINPMEVTVAEARPPQGGVTDTGKLPAKGSKITITNLKDAVGWQGPGKYFIPLVRTTGENRFSVPRIPASVGGPEKDTPRIYQATPDVDAQFKSFAPQP